MGTQPLPELAHRGWLRSLRIFTTLSLLLFLVAVAVYSERNIAAAIMLAPWVPWCLAVLWLVRSNPPKKSGLALAVAVSSIPLPPLLEMVLFTMPEILSEQVGLLKSVVMGYLVLLTIAQVGMVVSASKTYYSLKREASDLFKLGVGFAIPISTFILMTLVLPNFEQRYFPRQSRAFSNIRTVVVANITYSETYQQGFAGTLAQLGPPSEACPAVSSACADLLDELLSGVNPATVTPVKRDYRFTYLAPNPAPSPDRPNATYSLTATPASRRQIGRTFCVDQTDVVLRDTFGKMRTGTAGGCGWPIGGTIGPL